jgi:hypothetical protein
MADNPQDKAWAEAIKMARTGKFKGASDVVEKLRAEGYGRDVDTWRDQSEYDRLEKECRDASEAKRDR